VMPVFNVAITGRDGVDPLWPDVPRIPIPSHAREWHDSAGHDDRSWAHASDGSAGGRRHDGRH
jgi:hypothetical protein